MVRGMRFMGVLGGMLLVAGAAVAQKQAPEQGQPPKMSTPAIHHSACELAQSMAGKLADNGIVDQARARQTCQMLVPTMKESDQADFLRCCVERLTKGAPPAQRPKAQPDGREGT